jgi:hypothetical protein
VAKIREYLDGSAPACGTPTPPAAAINQQPQGASVAQGQPVTFTVTTTGAPPAGYQWMRNNVALSNNARIQGATTSALTINPALTTDAGAYSVNIVMPSCGDIQSQPATLTVSACGTSDFNGDGDFGTDADIEAFFACLSGSCCGACFWGGADFNGDGDFGTDADIEAFFRVLSGGSC